MKYRLVNKGNGLHELRRDILHSIKEGLIFASAIVPFPLLGLFSAPLWAWLIYFGWIFLMAWANVPPMIHKARRRKRRFKHFEIDRELKNIDLEDVS